MLETFDDKYWLSEIQNNSSIICADIEIFKNNRGAMSSQILSVLRNFDEACMCFIREKSINVNSNEIRYDKIKNSLSYAKRVSKLCAFTSLYGFLEKSTSHYTPVGEYAERLLLKYISYLIQIRQFFRKEFSLDILSSINKFPLDMDSTFECYYKTVIAALPNCESSADFKGSDSYYVSKKKTIYLEGTVLFEYTLTPAIDNNSKFDRFIAFSLLNIENQYCINAIIQTFNVTMFSKNMPVFYLCSYRYAVRPCELEKINFILGFQNSFSRTSEYWKLMQWIKDSGLSLSNLISMEGSEYKRIIEKVFESCKESALLRILNTSRDIVQNKKSGKNVLLYLLHNLNNQILKSQFPLRGDTKIPCLNLTIRDLLFDAFPFCTSLVNHNPKITDVLGCINLSGHESELLERNLKMMSIEEAIIYCPIDELGNPEEIVSQAEVFNSRLTLAQQRRRIVLFKDNAYLEENEADTCALLKTLQSINAKPNFANYSIFASNRINQLAMQIDDPIKQKALINMFSNGNVFAAYGPAGTGKSTLARFVLQILGNVSKICLANTNPAVENMKRKIGDESINYKTIYSFSREIKEKTVTKEYDILVVDECSNIATKDFLNILSYCNFKLILLLGDTYQIECIKFGNWFGLCPYFLGKNRYIVLENQFRSKNKSLPLIWKAVRNVESNIEEILQEYQVSHPLDESILNPLSNDEVILCLNYDGLYGINNINRVLQLNNRNPEFRWKQYIFKVGDPILFSENFRFSKVLYNNLKGVIEEIKETDTTICFTIKIDETINPFSDDCSGFNFISNEKEGKSLISFSLFKMKSEDYDNDSSPFNQVPFQIAYAISIHKSQGLEFESVKIILTNEVEEVISHNIFYTAITRARKYLNIYWTPETERNIIGGFSKRSDIKDANILREKFPELLSGR